MERYKPDALRWRASYNSDLNLNQCIVVLKSDLLDCIKLFISQCLYRVDYADQYVFGHGGFRAFVLPGG